MVSDIKDKLPPIIGPSTNPPLILNISSPDGFFYIANYFIFHR